MTVPQGGESARYGAKWLALVALAQAAIGALNVGAGASRIIRGKSLWPSLLFCGGAAIFCGALAVFYVYEYRKEVHGSDRQAEADSRDSGSIDLTITVDTSSYASAFAALARAGTNASLTAEPEEPIETVQSDMPILAHRIARLRFDGKQPFVSLNDGVRFGLDADARCDRNNGFYGQLRYVTFGETRPKPHKAPALGCSCGFYALPSDIEPWDDGADYVTLLVELSGSVIEHEKGYRAQHQRVIECQIPSCPYCGGRADAVVAVEGQMTSVGCLRHLPATMPASGVIVSVPDIAALVGVPITSRGEARDA